MGREGAGPAPQAPPHLDPCGASEHAVLRPHCELSVCEAAASEGCVPKGAAGPAWSSLAGAECACSGLYTLATRHSLKRCALDRVHCEALLDALLSRSASCATMTPCPATSVRPANDTECLKGCPVRNSGCDRSRLNVSELPRVSLGGVVCVAAPTAPRCCACGWC